MLCFRHIIVNNLHTGLTNNNDNGNNNNNNNVPNSVVCTKRRSNKSRRQGDYTMKPASANGQNYPQ